MFAEAYNPEDDDGDDTKVTLGQVVAPYKVECSKVVHPKTDEQRSRLQIAALKCLLFKTLDEAQLTEVIDAMFEQKVEAGEFLINEGDDGDFFYVIEEGVYSAIKTEKTVYTYDNEGNFGELALLYNMPRAASVKVSSIIFPDIIFIFAKLKLYVCKFVDR